MASDGADGLWATTLIRNYVSTYSCPMVTVDELHQELAALRARVSVLESPAAEEQAAPLPTDAMWALTEVQRRRGESADTTPGVVMAVGSLNLPTGEPVAWQESTGTAGLLDSEWGDLTDTLAALGHPVRLELLRQILGGVRSTAELAATDSRGTTGQLHHHLRQLKAAGWVQQSGRGSYEVPAARVVPLLTTILGARR